MVEIVCVYIYIYIYISHLCIALARQGDGGPPGPAQRVSPRELGVPHSGRRRYYIRI